MHFRSDISSCATHPIEAVTWIDEIESAKSIADLKTSYFITTSQVADETSRFLILK